MVVARGAELHFQFPYSPFRAPQLPPLFSACCILAHKRANSVVEEFFFAVDVHAQVFAVFHEAAAAEAEEEVEAGAAFFVALLSDWQPPWKHKRGGVSPPASEGGRILSGWLKVL